MTHPRFQTRRAAPVAAPGAARAAASTVASTAEPVPGAGRALHVVTFGCQMNKYDSLLVEGRFRARGWRLVERMEQADAIVFNTCSVREHAEERVWSWLGELKHAKAARPDLVIGVMGCLAQRAEEQVFQRAAHVDVVAGTRRIQHLPELVEELLARRAEPGPGRSAPERLLDTAMDSEVRVDRRGEFYAEGVVGHLAAMRGCDLNCAFCIVPTVRGRVQSRPVRELVEEARWMAEGGCRVLVLLGQTLNSYGEDLPEPGQGEARGRGRKGRPALADLLYALEGVEGIERVRMITQHPAYVTRALAVAMRECRKVERFLPLPAQSGSDSVLRAMRRGYSADLYRRKVELLREEVADVELGSDWIVGFPGEREQDYRATEAFLEEIGFSHGYVFKYDPRPGTAAASRDDDVPREVKEERHARLLLCVEASARRRMQAQIGREQELFLEAASPRWPGELVGRSRQGLPMRIAGPEEWIGRAVRARAEEASAFGLAGVALAGEAQAGER